LSLIHALEYFNRLNKWIASTGSWAFLIGSVMQLYEAVWREPEVEDSGHDVSKS
jgi:hypothetical protein